MKNSIKNKLLILLSSVVISLVLLISLIVGYRLKSIALSEFQEDISLNVKLIDHEINLFFENAKDMVSMLANNKTVRETDDSFNTYYDKTVVSDVTKISKSATEQKIYNLFETVDKNYDDFVCVFMGTKDGGYTSTCDTALSGGYDPRKRPWYTSANKTKGKPAMARAYKSTVGSAVIAISQSIHGKDNEHLGNVSIEVTLKKLTDFIADLHIGTSGYVMLLQDDGVILADPKHSDFNFKNISETDIEEFTELGKMSSGTLTMTMDDEKWYAVVHTVKNLNWKLIAFKKESEIFAGFYKIMKSMLIISAILLVIYLIISSIFAMRLVKPILNVADALKNISQGDGDLTSKLDTKGADELSKVSHYFNETILKINTAMKSIMNNTNNINNIGQTLSSNMTETASSINEISANIDGVKTQVLTQSAGVTEISSTVEEIIQTIRQLNNGVTTQSNNLNELLSVIEESNKTTGTTKDVLKKNDELIYDLVEDASEGNNAIKESEQEVNKILEESGSLLEASSIIQNIASQTNLLAMNAAIEAAHAGESGKGFAVVADEIRKLAEESSAQGKVITTSLKNLSTEIERVSSSSSNIGERFKSIFAKVNEVKNMSAEIMNIAETRRQQSTALFSLVENVSSVTDEVKYGSEEMLKGGEQVATEMQKLDELTRVITDSMNEMAAGASQINNAVQEVNDLTQQNKDNIKNLSIEINKFKV